MKAYEHHGIDPDEYWGALMEAYIAGGMSPDAAAAQARAGTEEMKQVEHQDWRLHELWRSGGDGQR